MTATGTHVLRTRLRRQGRMRRRIACASLGSLVRWGDLARSVRGRPKTASVLLGLLGRWEGLVIDARRTTGVLEETRATLVLQTRAHRQAATRRSIACAYLGIEGPTEDLAGCARQGRGVWTVSSTSVLGTRHLLRGRLLPRTARAWKASMMFGMPHGSGTSLTNGTQPSRVRRHGSTRRERRRARSAPWASGVWTGIATRVRETRRHCRGVTRRRTADAFRGTRGLTGVRVRCARRTTGALGRTSRLGVGVTRARRRGATSGRIASATLGSRGQRGGLARSVQRTRSA